MIFLENFQAACCFRLTRHRYTCTHVGGVSQYSIHTPARDAPAASHYGLFTGQWLQDRLDRSNPDVSSAFCGLAGAFCATDDRARRRTDDWAVFFHAFPDTFDNLPRRRNRIHGAFAHSVEAGPLFSDRVKRQHADQTA
jgi:hypothetical protein